MTRRKSHSQYVAAEPWFATSPDAACTRLEDEVNALGGWTAPNNPRVREYLAREVLDGGMPLDYTARNHGLPSSRVRKWVQIFREQGRAGLEALTDLTHRR